MIKVLYVPFDAPPATLLVEPRLDHFKEMVGGWLEVINLGEAFMYLNEEGKLLGLPMNTNANRITSYYNAGLAPGDHIVGNVFLSGHPDEEGYETSVSKEVIDAIARICD